MKGAAERAAGLGSHAQALAFLQQALEITTQPADQADLLERIGSLAGPAALGDLARGVAGSAPSPSDGRRVIAPAVARATYLLGRSRLGLPGTRGALDVLGRGRGVRGPGRRPGRDRARWSAGPCLCPARPRAGSPRSVRSRPGRRGAADLVDVIADTLITRGTVLMNAFRYREGTGRCSGHRHRGGGRPGRDALRGANNLAAHHERTDPRAALQAIRGGLACPSYGVGDARRESFATQYGFAAYRTGDWAIADGLISAAAGRRHAADIPRSRLIQDRWRTGWPRGVDLNQRPGGAARQVATGRRDRSRDSGLLDTAAVEAWFDGRLADARQAPWPATTWRPSRPSWFLRRAAASVCAISPAARADLAAVRVAGAHGPVLAADRSLLRAGGPRPGGRDQRGAARLPRRAHQLRALGLRWDVALCGLDMIEVLPGEAESLEAAADARDLMVELGAAPFLARIDAALAAGVPAAPPAATA